MDTPPEQNAPALEAQEPVFDTDMEAFWHNPYPALQQLRELTPVARMPPFNWVILSRYQDIADYINRPDLLTSDFREDGMVQSMGHNMMRKDGEDHRKERTAILPTIAPKTAKNIWTEKFEVMVSGILDEVHPRGNADFVSEIAGRICGEALKLITGLYNMSWQDIDRHSQTMMDAISSLGLDPSVGERVALATNEIDLAVDQIFESHKQNPDHSLLSSQLKAELSPEQIKNNIKLAISGGQNEPRDVLSGSVYALLKDPEQLDLVRSEDASWNDVFDEYVRWISPIQIHVRKVIAHFELYGTAMKPDDMLVFMLASGHRDASVYEDPNTFKLLRRGPKNFAFGAGAHFCAGAHSARALIANVALPMIFERFKNLRLAGDVPFGGWVFRGALSMPIAWDA